MIACSESQAGVLKEEEEDDDDGRSTTTTAGGLWDRSCSALHSHRRKTRAAPARVCCCEDRMGKGGGGHGGLNILPQKSWNVRTSFTSRHTRNRAAVWRQLLSLARERLLTVPCARETRESPCISREL